MVFLLKFPCNDCTLLYCLATWKGPPILGICLEYDLWILFWHGRKMKKDYKESIDERIFFFWKMAKKGLEREYKWWGEGDTMNWMSCCLCPGDKLNTRRAEETITDFERFQLQSFKLWVTLPELLGKVSGFWWVLVGFAGGVLRFVLKLARVLVISADAIAERNFFL